MGQRHSKGAVKFETHHAVSLHVQHGENATPTLRVLSPFRPAQVITAATVSDTTDWNRTSVGVTALAVSPTWRAADRQYSLAAGSGDGSIRVFCSSTERNYVTLWHGRRGLCGVRTVAFSPDGTHLASGGTDHNVRIWGLPLDTTKDYRCTPNQSRKTFCVAKFCADSAVWSVAYSPAGGLLAAATEAGTVLTWPVESGTSGAPRSDATQRLRDNGGSSGGASPMRGPTDVPTTCAATEQHDAPIVDTTPGQATLIPDDSAASVVDYPDDVVVFPGHENYAKVVCFTPDGTLLASTGGDRAVRLWRVEDSKCVAEFSLGEGPGTLATCMAFSPDGGLLVVGIATAGVMLFDAQEAVAVAMGGGERTATQPKRVLAACCPATRLQLGLDRVIGTTALAFTSAGGGTALAVVNTLGQTLVWATVPNAWELDPAPLVLQGAHTDHTFSVAFSPHGSSVITGSRDGTAIVWRRRPRGAMTGVEEDRPSTGPLSDISASQVASASGPVPAADETCEWLLDTRFDTLHIGGGDGSPKKWSPMSSTGGLSRSNSDRALHGIRPAHGERVELASFSPSGSVVITASIDAVCVWHCGGLVTPPSALGTEEAAAEFYQLDSVLQAQKRGPTLVSRIATPKNAGSPTRVVWSPHLGRCLASPGEVPCRPRVYFLKLNKPVCVEEYAKCPPPPQQPTSPSSP